jgi:hypothetical protein
VWRRKRAPHCSCPCSQEAFERGGKSRLMPVVEWGTVEGGVENMGGGHIVGDLKMAAAVL